MDFSSCFWDSSEHPPCRCEFVYRWLSDHQIYFQQHLTSEPFADTYLDEDDDEFVQYKSSQSCDDLTQSYCGPSPSFCESQNSYYEPWPSYCDSTPSHQKPAPVQYEAPRADTARRLGSHRHQDVYRWYRCTGVPHQIYFQQHLTSEPFADTFLDEDEYEFVQYRS
ncbi:hypothetical protein HF086_002781 [Spodoptera exigua]|uniref:Uncharacterized protein n=1 Tax=Spodoptera exigua TaxID=7107 RepID=A0A922MTJ4_SPOEX|nr:hypothetical protein HF086_002781 [Spodoptera exigua]